MGKRSSHSRCSQIAQGCQTDAGLLEGLGHEQPWFYGKTLFARLCSMEPSFDRPARRDYRGRNRKATMHRPSGRTGHPRKLLCLEMSKVWFHFRKRERRVKTPKALQWHEGEAMSPLDPVPLKAMAAKCPECGSFAFSIFQIEGHDHAHLECCACGVSYCYKGKCL